MYVAAAQGKQRNRIEVLPTAASRHSLRRPEAWVETFLFNNRQQLDKRQELDSNVPELKISKNAFAASFSFLAGKN